MSENKAYSVGEESPKNVSFTIRLTPQDQAALAELCSLYGLKRPDSIRRAIKQALTSKKNMNKSGNFISVGSEEPSEFVIHME